MCIRSYVESSVFADKGSSSAGGGKVLSLLQALESICQSEEAPDIPVGIFIDWHWMPAKIRIVEMPRVQGS